VTNPRWKHRWWIWDQGLIYLLIAGSYTGFGLPLLQIPSNRWLLAVIWALALTGFFFKILRRRQNDQTSTISYVALAWVPILGVQSATTLLPTSSLYWLFSGGLLYTSGVLFLLLDRRMPYFHALWHLLVMAGSICHFIGIYQIVLSMLGAAT
jgi:hemolysin III